MEVGGHNYKQKKSEVEDLNKKLHLLERQITRSKTTI